MQANRYAHANASPLTGTDPTGRSSQTILPGGSLQEAGSGRGGCISSGSICYETEQNDYMSGWSPRLTTEELATNWILVGGMESIRARR
ncbi:hypothetical protein HCN51_27400 [Nonomuraea sp. FMUSA5-5]|uniref:Uncharacterized protein n=1 Tax=Nonomuraea composti TaxID=2720023 RepID=A0ABX1B5L9_9ACTN|nr:hypothetical protein [Nonomuraea sp. FMUSA5-5]NJP93128.1 hypothetical protein [Nonomuraea sp. FMUSA5-5]